jgi:hypothetical protein
MIQSDMLPLWRAATLREVNEMSLVTGTARSGEAAAVAEAPLQKARLIFATDLEQKAQEVADLQEVLKERDSKLARLIHPTDTHC